MKLVNGHYECVTRYTTSSFLRLKLGDALKRRGVSPYIYESPEEARGGVSLLQAHIVANVRSRTDVFRIRRETVCRARYATAIA